MRIAARIFPLLAAILGLIAAAPAWADAQVELRPSLTTHGASITLSDLFEGAAGPAGAVVVGQAATPGFNAVLDAGKIQLVAKAAGLDWTNAQGLRRLLVASAAGSGSPAGRANVRVARQTQALAYARNIGAGEIVQAADLVWSNDVIAPVDAPGDPDRVIGQAARRPVRAGAAVQRSDLVAATVIHRDEIIAVAFEAPGISLVLQGKALKDAAVGESVQVLNPQSQKIIEAVAAGPGRAVVGSAADQLKSAPFATASLR